MSSALSYLPIAVIALSAVASAYSLRQAWRTLQAKRIVHAEIKEVAVRDIMLGDLLERAASGRTLTKEDIEFAQMVISSAADARLSDSERRLLDVGLHQEDAKNSEKFIRNVLIAA